MLQERIEAHWLDAFETVLRRCALHSGETVAILGETQSRPVLMALAALACARFGAPHFSLRLPSLGAGAGPVSRSTGASQVLRHNPAVLAALKASQLVIDCTVEGLMHAPELPELLGGDGKTQPRVLYVSNEHPETLARLLPDEATEQRVKHHIKRLRQARQMRVHSAAGTDLVIDLDGAVCGGNWGSTTRPGTLSHWPGGLVLAFPAARRVNGRLVLAEGDVNLTFKRYLERPVQLQIVDDHIVDIEGRGLDADLLRSHFEAWSPPGSDRAAYAVSHVGYGLNPAARWDSMAMLDKRDFNGTELRAFSGNFLYSTGANETAQRFTEAHFDWPMRHCSIDLDGQTVVDQGRVLDLAP